MRSTILALACAATFTVSAVALPASAQRLINERPDMDDPVMMMVQDYLPRDEFMLDNSDDVELIRFKTPHDIELCAGRADPAAVDGTRRGYAIAAAWDNDVAVIMPGNCLAFEAQRLKVKPAGRLPGNVVLTGTVRVIK